MNTTPHTTEDGADQATPVPEGVTLLSSGRAEGIEVPSDEFAERGEYLAELVTYIEEMLPYILPLKNGLFEDADEFLTPARAASYIADATESLIHEVILQGFCGELIAADVLSRVHTAPIGSAVTSVPRTTMSRYTKQQPRIDGGLLTRRRTWQDHDYEVEDLPTPPPVPNSVTFRRNPGALKSQAPASQ